MKPKVFEYHDENDLIQEVELLVGRGINKKKLYVVSLSSDRDRRIAHELNISKIGVKDEGVDTFAKNIFRKRANRLKAKFEEFGFDETEAKALESELEAGKMLLLQKEWNIYY